MVNSISYEKQYNFLTVMYQNMFFFLDYMSERQAFLNKLIFNIYLIIYFSVRSWTAMPEKINQRSKFLFKFPLTMANDLL